MFFYTQEKRLSNKNLHTSPAAPKLQVSILHQVFQPIRTEHYKDSFLISVFGPTETKTPAVGNSSPAAVGQARNKPNESAG